MALDVRPSRAEDGERLARARGAAARRWLQTSPLVRMLWLVAAAQFAFLAYSAYDAYDARAWDFWWIDLALDGYLAGGDPYDVYMYVNPPATLLLFAPLSALSFGMAHAVFLAASAACIAAAALLSLHAARVRWWGLAGAVALLLLAHPSAVRSTLGLGNVNSLIVLCEAAALVAMLGSRWVLGGIALGLSFAVKPILVPLLVVPLAARRWGSVALAVAIPVALSLLAIALNAGAIGFVTDKLSFLLSGNADVLQNGNVSILGTAENVGLPRAAGEVLRLATLVVALWLAWTRWRAPADGADGDADRRLRVIETTGLLLLATLLCFSFSWLYYGLYLLPLAVTVARPGALLRHPVALAGLALMIVPFGDRMQEFEPQGFEIVRPALSWLLILAGMGLALRGPAALRVPRALSARGGA